MGMILSLTTSMFLLMVHVACYHAISAPIGTSSEIILKSGEEGTLQCGFKGRAQTVSWTYQGSSSKQLLLIKLDMLQQIGQRRVYGYGEGRYNISEDFSLIIHEVTDEDEGRYTCKVLESFTCSLLRNYTFVSVAGMHSEVILKSGEDGTLPCNTESEAHVVYWTYQDASSKPVLLARLELFHHQVGQRRVTLHAEERYNITDDFSLIIRDVTLADEGRYTCEILELTGSIVRKHNDVSVPEVKTVPTVLLESGKKATLTCSYKRTMYAVYWRYESTTSQMELLVVLDYQEGERRGPGYEEGRFYINDDYSLTINNVEPQDEGRYTCEVSDFKTGLLLRNHTDVHTIVVAERPFVRIEQCEHSVSADDEPCVLHATSDHPSIQLKCTVVGAKPVVNLSWTSSMTSEHWKQVMNESTFTKNGRGDGTFNQTLTVNVDPSYFTSDIQHFTCIAGGLAVDGKASLTISVYLAHAKDVNVTRKALTSITATLAVTAVLIGISWKASPKCRNNSMLRPANDDWSKEFATSEGTLEDKIKRIKNMKADELVYLGVLGDEGAGKSSFINSIKCLIKGKDGSTAPMSSKRTHDNNSVWEYTEFISNGLRIRKQRDDKPMIEPKQMSAILKKEDNPSSTRHRRNMERSDLIHYPIFIFDIRNRNNWDNRIKLLTKFSEAVHNHILQYPMIVLTKASAVAELDEETSMMELIVTTRIPFENFLVTFQYSDPNVPDDEYTRFEQMDFILRCVAQIYIQKKNIKKHLRRGHRRGSYDPISSNDTGV